MIFKQICDAVICGNQFPKAQQLRALIACCAFLGLHPYFRVRYCHSVLTVALFTAVLFSE